MSSEIEGKIKELKDLLRLIENTLNLIADIQIKGSDVFAVAEIIQWLDGFRKSVTANLGVLSSTLPTQGGEQDNKVIVPEVVESK